MEDKYILCCIPVEFLSDGERDVAARWKLHEGLPPEVGAVRGQCSFPECARPVWVSVGQQKISGGIVLCIECAAGAYAAMGEMNVHREVSTVRMGDQPKGVG